MVVPLYETNLIATTMSAEKNQNNSQNMPSTSTGVYVTSSTYSTFNGNKKCQNVEAKVKQSKSSTHKSNKDLIGNNKEFRIEQNNHNLRIIGNNNRIRIAHNTANLQILGNNTNLKITNNSGNIKYTGNNGHICLGSASTQQAVDYIGNNGKLKVKTRQQQSDASSSSAASSANATPNTTPTTEQQAPQFICASCNNNNKTARSSSANMRSKSASYGGAGSAVYDADWQAFSEMFKLKNWQNLASLPNLKENHYFATNNSTCCSCINCKCKCYEKPIHFAKNIENIVIKNASNISIRV